MAETTQNVSKVTKTSDGTVKLSIERYEELVEKAAEKVPVVYNSIQKTQAMVAQDNKVWGGVMLAGGICLGVIGGALHLLGRAQQRALDKETRTES